MDPNGNGWDDDRMATLFASADQEGAPPDRELLARLRDESTRVFQEQAEPEKTTPRRSAMFFIKTVLATTAAAAAIVMVAMWMAGESDRDETNMQPVLEKLVMAQTLQLQITVNGETQQAWVRRPGQMRINKPDGTYRIVHGSRQWDIDEKANRASSRPATFFVAAGKLAPLDLLGVPTSVDTDKSLAKAAVEQVRQGGQAFDIYRATLSANNDDGEKVRIEAACDAGTQNVRWLRSFAVCRTGLEPIAEVNVLAVNKPVGEDLFVVGETLTEDGRIGKVTDAQGIVSVKPVMHRRWTPVYGPVILKPGDWLRTDVRGANAVALRLVKQTDVTLGPGTLVELPTPRQMKLVSGEAKIVGSKRSPVELLGPDDQRVTIKDTAIYRVDERTNQLALVKKPPLWLRGFEGTTAQDSIGSLVANIDGRNVPLTVGYHKVTVDIRDQIARTVIEESFQNRTNGRLEGVFYFPLPQDASISGFGMWIGNELVEADVVEKQRAREIYETILRERRDPGLLEWTGGNLFKARVFPIEARSEKRIKITYTQVLPLKNNRYRYSYALQSEMLKLHPLRELSIDLKVSSVLPLADVTSPTHMARIDKTGNTAHVEFTAQEYTPDRDFEAVFEIEGSQQEVVLIPHRRGDDGYFMLQLTPPVPDAAEQRETLPDGEPLELLILADTSGSMDVASRERQAEFVAALLGSLTPDDRFNVAACDVGCDWAFDAPRPASDDNVRQARELLDRRVSLGWTDLDKAFQSALVQCGPNTQVVYVGDGVVNTVEADPVAFGKRLRRLHSDGTSALHAVSIGSSFESIVLGTIASLGGGSVRQVSGQQTPQKVAAELLGEITRPAIRDMAVDFRGLRVARVYPERLPNLAGGAQQILIGRYLPEGEDQQGEVVVTGLHGDKPVKFSAPVSLQDAQHGNSFIPRLWARMHLDALLNQGASTAIKDEIIALSEEYNIITPYTSLLVLETDEDRERFKVKRRFRMRDGEKFFAEGRDQADFELLQKQMRLAGNWRLGLRRQVLRELMGLGRDTNMFQRVRGPEPGLQYFMAGGEFSVSNSRGVWHGIGGGSMGGAGGYSNQLARIGDRRSELGKSEYHWYADEDENGAVSVNGEDLSTFDVDGDFERGESADITDWQLGEPVGDAELQEVELSSIPWDGELRQENKSLKHKAQLDLLGPMGMPGPSSASRAWNRGSDRSYALGLDLQMAGVRVTSSQDVTFITGLFPHLPPTATEPVEPVESRWPAEARRLAERLLRTRQLAELDGGLSIERQVDSFDVRWDELSGRSNSLVLAAPTAWLTRSGGDGSETLVHWCGGPQRGVFSADFQLGRVRDAKPLDLDRPPLGLSGFVQDSLAQRYAGCDVEVRKQSDTRVLLVLTFPTTPAHAVHVLVDTERDVILWIENRQHDQVTSSNRFNEFIRVADAWWATRVEQLNQDGKRTSVTTLKFAELSREAFDHRIERELAPRDRVQFLREPLTTVIDAKQAVADGKATFDEQMALVVHRAGSQNWGEVFEHLEKAEQLAAGKPGMRWVRNAVLNQSRRREELRQRILDEAAKLARSPDASFFLAQGQISSAAGIFEANEMLALLDVLRPVYQRQPDYLRAMKQWTEQRVNYLQQVGQSDEVLRLSREQAEQYPRDAELQRLYVYALSHSGNYAAAYAWLDRVIVPSARWLPQEEYNLRDTYTNLLEQEGRYEDMVEYLAAWIERNPEWQTAYAQYLSALVKSDREDEANRLIGKWLEEGRQAGPLPEPDHGRLNAAINQALGQGHNLYTNRLEERWLEPLRETAEFFATHPTQSYAAGNIMGNWRFQQTDACRAARTKMLQILGDGTDTLPAHTVQSLVSWISPNDPAIEVQQWRQLANRLTKRWAEESDPDIRHQLGAAAIQILSTLLTADEHIAFLRRQLEDASAKYRGMYANQLFDALLNQPWSSDHEDELFSLLPQQSSAMGGGELVRDQVAALHRLTDRMLQARYDAGMAKVDHAENLTRTELQEKQQQAQRLAREGYAARLDKAVPELPAELTPWLRAERLYVDVLLGRNLNKVADECWEVIGAKPTPINVTDDHFAGLLEAVLRHRHLTMLANMAARRSADPALVDRLLAYLDAGIAAADGDIERFAWRLFKYRLLVALDRPKSLEPVLRAWIRPEEADNYWRRALGYLMAEQGRIKESIKLFERIEADDELSPADYRALAGWYMAADARDKHERALIESFKATDEWRLSNWLNQKLQPWRRREGALPSELDKDVLRVFAALFEKSAHPQNYSWQLEQFYRASRDFRLLAGLADAVVGHTAGKVYPLLGAMRSVLNEVRDEATADSIVEHLAKVRERATTPVDHRALDLLESMVERRSSEMLNQPGPHVERALAAMQRAFKREWSEGEPRLMADFLAGFGRISQKPLADEQVRQLEVLHNEAEKGTAHRLHIAYGVAQAYWSYSRHAEALDLLTAALDERRDACDGVLPATANGPLGTLISYLETRVHHARGERLLLDELKHPANRQQTFWLTQRLYRLYESAIAGDGDVSLGRGSTLYRAVNRQLQDELNTDDHNHRYNLANRLCGIYRMAHDRKISGVAEDVRAFAFDRLPEVLGQQTNNYQSIVSTVAQTLRDLSGPRDGLELLIVQIEREPKWFRLNNQDGWSQHSYQLARWRRDVGDKLGNLEPRLLKIVIAELKRDLQTQQSRSRNMYHDDHGSYFWSEKRNDFARAAEEVYAQRKNSGTAVKYIAKYLYEGLARKDRAIEILLIAHQKDEVLDEAGQSQLVLYLQWQHRHGESIPILEPLVERRPDTMQYRLQLMNAYHQTGQQAKLLALLKQTDAYFHQEGRWQEDAISSLAYGCLQNHLFEQSVAYYEELISLHQRTQPRRGIGNETLSEYYGNMSKAYASLNKTVEAVDAACGAIVSWGPRHDRRGEVLHVLESVLRDAPDLDDYVAYLDKQSAQEGMENPVVRKALGEVFFDKQQYKQAIVHLKIARELQPNDTETHEKLVACYDKLGDKQGAIDQLLESVKLSRRNIGLYRDLGRRYDELQQPTSAERARTSIVEALPNESEGHTMLAEIRQKQNRWSDAIGHWQQVADIRSLEPIGLLNLATAQVHEKQWDAAAATCRKLRARTWPERFDNVDRQVRELEGKIDNGGSK